MAHAAGRADDAVVREQAYYFWEQDGRPEGREMEYWSRAAVAVAEKGQMDTLTKTAPKKPVSDKPKLAASKVKTAPAKTIKAAGKLTKAADKAKPKKK